MRDKSETSITVSTERRKRGRRPADASARRIAVESALRELTEARVPFSMGDLAERAGISRATLYRDAGLRDLVGAAGDGPQARPVNAADYRKLAERAEALAAERRELRRRLRETEKGLVDANERIDKLAEENRDRMRAARDAAAGAAANASSGAPSDAATEKIRTDAFAEGFSAGARAYQQRGATGARGGGGGADLISVAARLPRPALLNARKTLARALHPDLYISDPATALLATELFKQINALAAEKR